MSFRRFGTLVSLLLLSLVLSSCQDSAQSDVPVSSPQVSASSSSSLPAENSSSQESSSEPSESSKEESSVITDNSCFEDSAFVGNSLLDDLDMYGIIDNADFYAKTGLTVSTVFKESTEEGTQPIMDEVVSKEYRKVFFMFGINELGWSSGEVFIEKYAEIVDAVRAEHPDTVVYVQSLTPVTTEYSESNPYGETNERILEYNEMLKKFAKEKNVQYLDVYSALVTPDGDLDADATPDGVHPNMDYCKVWVQYLREHC